MHSLNLIDILLSEPEQSHQAVTMVEPRLAPDQFVVTLNEGWRGEISHCLLTDANGRVIRHKVKDPSFHNWLALALGVRNNEISDFPVSNKSFDLSYCGHDL